jgi:hypothetical protein
MEAIASSYSNPASERWDVGARVKDVMVIAALDARPLFESGYVA